MDISPHAVVREVAKQWKYPDKCHAYNDESGPEDNPESRRKGIRVRPDEPDIEDDEGPHQEHGQPQKGRPLEVRLELSEVVPVDMALFPTYDVEDRIMQGRQGGPSGDDRNAQGHRDQVQGHQVGKAFDDGHHRPVVAEKF